MLLPVIPRTAECRLQTSTLQVNPPGTQIFRKESFELHFAEIPDFPGFCVFWDFME